MIIHRLRGIVAINFQSVETPTYVEIARYQYFSR